MKSSLTSVALAAATIAAGPAFAVAPLVPSETFLSANIAPTPVYSFDTPEGVTVTVTAFQTLGDVTTTALVAGYADGLGVTSDDDDRYHLNGGRVQETLVLTFSEAYHIFNLHFQNVDPDDQVEVLGSDGSSFGSFGFTVGENANGRGYGWVRLIDYDQPFTQLSIITHKGKDELTFRGFTRSESSIAEYLVPTPSTALLLAPGLAALLRRRPRPRR